MKGQTFPAGWSCLLRFPSRSSGPTGRMPELSADLDPSDGDQGLGFAEVPPGESVKIQLFAHGTENLTGFVAQIEFDPGAVDGASTAIGFSPGPATPVTFPVTCTS